MAVCMSCGARTANETTFCTYHAEGGEWNAAVNRIMYDLIHRHRIPIRLTDIKERFHDVEIMTDEHE